jgi:hypothetical protein
MMIKATVRGIKFTKPSYELWQELKQGTELELEKEPDNPYDKNAIKVIYKGFHLGYIDKESALKMNKPDKALITRVYGTPIFKPHIEIDVEES